MDGFPVARYSASMGDEQKANHESKINIDEGQRMEREDGSQWDKLELGCNLLLIFLSDDAT
jgi:hypothetical protein